MENYPSRKEFSSTSDVDDDDDYQGFFTSELINSIADGFSYKEEIFNIGLQLGISHSISVQYKSRYDNLFTYASEVILLWRETYNAGDFEACRRLDSILCNVGFKGKASRLISGFLRWVNGHICCRDVVECNAKRAVSRLSKKDRLSDSVVKKYNKWCRQLKLENNDFHMALYFQLFGLQLYENDENHLIPFKTTLSYLNTSLKHHLPHDAFYLTVITNLDMENNVALSSSYMVKEIVEFFHCRRLAKIGDNLLDMGTIRQLAHALEVQEKTVRQAEYRHPNSLFLIGYDVLYGWKQNCPYLGEEDQVQCLIEALEEIDMKKLADEIKEDYRAWQMTSVPEFEICDCENKNKRRFLSSDQSEEQLRPIKCCRTCET